MKRRDVLFHEYLKEKKNQGDYSLKKNVTVFYETACFCIFVAVPSIINKHVALIENSPRCDVFNYGWSLSPHSSLRATAALYPQRFKAANKTLTA